MATLLIVEDDKQTNETICEYLKLAGHKIVAAYTSFIMETRILPQLEQDNDGMKL